MISLCWHSQVKTRTANENSVYGSHVMQYGDIGLSTDNLVWYLGTNPENENSTFVDENSLRPPTKAINQRDADLVHFWDKVCSPNCFYLSVTVLNSKYYEDLLIIRKMGHQCNFLSCCEILVCKCKGLSIINWQHLIQFFWKLSSFNFSL